MPFYERLTRLKSGDSAGLRVIAALPARETRQDGETYFAEHDVVVDGIETVNFMILGVTGTPTLVLLDGAGRVKASWVGRLSSDNEKDVLTKVKAICPKCTVS
jgi:hypothetical protein